MNVPILAKMPAHGRSFEKVCFLSLSKYDCSFVYRNRENSWCFTILMKHKCNFLIVYFSASKKKSIFTFLVLTPEKCGLFFTNIDLVHTDVKIWRHLFPAIGIHLKKHEKWKVLHCKILGKTFFNIYILPCESYLQTYYFFTYIKKCSR